MPEERSETAGLAPPIHSQYSHEFGCYPTAQLLPPWFVGRQMHCDNRSSSISRNNGCSPTTPVSVQLAPRLTVGGAGANIAPAAAVPCKTYRPALRMFNVVEPMSPPLSSSPPPPPTSCHSANVAAYGCCEYRYAGAAWQMSRWRRAYPPSFAAKTRDPQPQWGAAKCDDTRFGSGVSGNGRSSSPGSADPTGTSCSADHSRINTENFLPRIIKPRKRKKKDRKPNGADAASLSSSSTTSSASSSSSLSLQLQKSVDNMTNLPVSSGDTGRIFLSRALLEGLWSAAAAAAAAAVEQRGADSQLAILKSLQNFDGSDVGMPATTAEVDDEAVAVLAAVAAPEEAADSEVASAVFCNCRYCDPQGVVWDVKEKRYSANLMQPGVLSGSGGPGYGADTSFAPSEDRLGADRSSMAAVDTRQRINLQVSSQIVTSLNGHRDIEIKFYSSSSEKT